MLQNHTPPLRLINADTNESVEIPVVDGCYYVPEGRYKLSNPVPFRASDIRIEGCTIVDPKPIAIQSE